MKFEYIAITNARLTMSEDLITNPFIENINLTLIRRNQIIVKALLSICSLYCMLDIVNWFFILRSTEENFAGEFLYTYTLRIRPTISVIVLLTNLCSFFFNSRGNDLIAMAIHKENPELFNDGYRFFFRANVFFLFSFCIAAISVAIRIVLRY